MMNAIGGDENGIKASLNGTGGSEFEIPKMPVAIRLADVITVDLKNALGGDWTRSCSRHNFYVNRYFGNRNNKIRKINIVIDSSGSMWTADRQMLLIDILNSLGQDFEFNVIQCDTCVTTDILENLTELPEDFKIVGGGGTFLSPAFEKITELELDEFPTVVFSDGELFSENEKSFDCIWVSFSATQYIKALYPDDMIYCYQGQDFVTIK